VKDWIMVRLQRSTRKRLAELLESQRRREDLGQTELPESEKPGQADPSVDWLVNLALDRIDAQRQRARKQRQRKSAAWQLHQLQGEVETTDVQAFIDDVIDVVPDDVESRPCGACGKVAVGFVNTDAFGVQLYRCTNCHHEWAKLQNGSIAHHLLGKLLE